MATLSRSALLESIKARKEKLASEVPAGFVLLPDGRIVNDPTFRLPSESSQATPDQIAAEAMAEALAKSAASQFEMLSPSEAREFQVPFGTTRGQVQGKVPLSSTQIDLNNQLNQIDEIINQIDRLSENVNDFGPLARGYKGPLNKLGALFQFDQDATLLESKAGVLGPLIRALGEKGALAEGDISRAKKLIPTVTDSEPVAERKIQELRDLIQSAKTGAGLSSNQSSGSNGGGSWTIRERK